MSQSSRRRPCGRYAVWRRLLGITLLAGGPVLPGGLAVAAPLALTVAVGESAEDPAYLPVHAAAALGTFAAEGIEVTLRRSRHPTAAVAALRQREAELAVTTLDQAIRGAWIRDLPVRVVLAHTRAPAAALLVSSVERDRVTRVEQLRGKKVATPAPGSTGALLLAAILRGARLGPVDVEQSSLGGAAAAGRLAGGELTAAVLEEPWVSRVLTAGTGVALVDFRRPDETVRVLKGPFYEIVSIAPSVDAPHDEKTARARGAKDKNAPVAREIPAAALAAYARAVIRVQAWLATASPPAVADRLPRNLVGERDRFIARLAALQATYAPTGEATVEGLEATLRVLRGGSPWPSTLKVTPAELREPAVVSEARTRLGASPPPP